AARRGAAFCFLQAEDGIRDATVTGVQTCALPISRVAGPLIATVVGPDGSTQPQGDQELHVDALHRVRIRYEFQDADPAGAPASRSEERRVGKGGRTAREPERENDEERWVGHQRRR